MSKTVLVNDLSVTLAAGVTSALIPHGIVEISGPKLPDDVYPDSASAIVCVLKTATHVQFHNAGAMDETDVSFRVWRMHSEIRVPGVTYDTQRKWQGLGPNAGGGGGGSTLQAAYTAGGAGGGAITLSGAGGPILPIASDAATVTSSQALIVEHITSGVAAPGFGVNIGFALENGAGAPIQAMQLGAGWVAAGAGAETAALTLALRDQGGLVSNVLVVQPVGIHFVQSTPLPGGGGSYQMLKLSGAALTNLTAGVENISVDVDTGPVVQFATGALAMQRATVFRAPSYGFVAASTLTTAATVAITGAPNADANATITHSYSLWSQAGINSFDGTVKVGTAGASSIAGDVAVQTGGATQVVSGTTLNTASAAFLAYDDLGGNVQLARGGSTNAVTLFGVSLASASLLYSAAGALIIGTGDSTSITLGSNGIARFFVGANAEAANETACAISVNSVTKRIHAKAIGSITTELLLCTDA